MGCELCSRLETPACMAVAATPRLRVVRVLDAPDFPAFYRVIWNAHVAEFSDLNDVDRAHAMDTVVTVERALRERLSPTKINLAALGNMVPHLHWHVIARFERDSHFPQPIWGTRQRDSDADALARIGLALPMVDERIAAALATS
ncbi:MAG: HIT family protein [Burkholderiales bacterium]|nr:HIT family protein [Burkholderiales bacterium]